MNLKIKKISTGALLLLLLFVTGTDLFSCDIWAALANATARGLTLLAKNSDRLLFDCQPLMFFPRKQWPVGSTINLGRICVPQVEETYATLRQKYSLGLLEEKNGEVTTRWMKRIARDRSTYPSLDLDQTASSCVAVLPKSQEGRDFRYESASDLSTAETKGRHF